jgi:hypothetical protein
MTYSRRSSPLTSIGHGPHIGLHALGALADRLGLGDALSARIPPAGERLPLHDRGTVLTQAMLMLAGGGESCAHIEALRAQDRLFGHVPSDSTVYRTFRQIDPGTLGRRTRPAKRSPACCGRATPGPTASPITSRTKSRGRRHKSRLVRAGEG